MIFILMDRFGRGRLRSLRRERGSLVRMSMYLVLIAAVSTVVLGELEGLSLADALWLTLTTMTTVGYGDLSAATPGGRVATVVVIYGGGIFVLGKAAGDYLESRAEVQERKKRGQWRWRMKGHVVVVNAPANGAARYFTTLVEELRRSRWGATREVVVVTEAWGDGIPPELTDEATVHVHGRGDRAEDLERASVATASCVLVLARDPQSGQSDAVVLDVLENIKATGTGARVVAECVNDRNRERMRDAVRGADAVLRPLRGYPEMAVREMIAPGSSEIITDIFTADGNCCLRYECAVGARRWAQVSRSVLEAGGGTVIGYAKAHSDERVLNPGAQDIVDAQALFVIAHEKRRMSESEIAAVLRASPQE